MLIKKKVLLSVIIFNFGALLSVYFAFRLIISSAYYKLEVDTSSKNIERIMNVIETRISYLETFARDYSAWDDSYKFVDSPSTEFDDSNLSIDIFKTFKLNFIIYVNKDGEVIYGKAADYRTGKYTDLPDGLSNYIFKEAPLLSHSSVVSSIKGILSLDKVNVLIASLPITHSDGSGPINGTLIFGSYIDSYEINTIKDITNYDLTIYNYKLIKPEISTILGVYEGQKDQYITPKNNDYFLGYKLQRDIFGKPAVIVETMLPRQLEKEGVKTFYFLMGFMVLIGMVFSVFGILMLNKMILSRINSLSVQVNAIKNTKSKVKMSGKDEISNLASNINSMIDEIESTSTELKSVNDLLVNKTMDLEKINKLLIGREVKMTELKAKIRELEDKFTANASIK